MRLLARPWSLRDREKAAFGPGDCLLLECDGDVPRDIEHVPLLRGSIRERKSALALVPYPKREAAKAPLRKGFPVRPRRGHEPVSDAERLGAKALQRMNEVLARVQELEEALDDPENTWGRLRRAWERAEKETDPRMAEIVRQAREMVPVLQNLTGRFRKVLRRHRELTPLSRVREMDRASMTWLARQPGRNVPERAGSSQRILATVRRENFDTLENRVLHAYARLAADAAREWLREHPRANASERYRNVESFRKRCRALATELAGLGVAVAEAGVAPNYVLMQDHGYRKAYESWVRLLQRRQIEDDLWAWQAEMWTDFCVLALILAIDEMEEAQLMAQSPVLWRAESSTGRWFGHDSPIAVFWLRETGRVVEIQARPENPGSLLTAARAHVALRISDLGETELPRRVVVWTPHAMERLDLGKDVREAVRFVEQQLQPLATNEVLRHGLILTPAHEHPEHVPQTRPCATVHGIAIGGSGDSLKRGFRAVRRFIRSDIYRGAE